MPAVLFAIKSGPGLGETRFQSQATRRVSRRGSLTEPLLAAGRMARPELEAPGPKTVRAKLIHAGAGVAS